MEEGLTLGSWAWQEWEWEGKVRDGAGNFRSRFHSVYLATLRNPISLQRRSDCRLQGAGKKGGRPRVIAGSTESPALGLEPRRLDEAELTFHLCAWLAWFRLKGPEFGSS